MHIRFVFLWEWAVVLEVGRECEAAGQSRGWSPLVACKVKLLRLCQTEQKTWRVLQYTLNNVNYMVKFFRLRGRIAKAHHSFRWEAAGRSRTAENWCGDRENDEDSWDTLSNSQTLLLRRRFSGSGSLRSHQREGDSVTLERWQQLREPGDSWRTWLEAKWSGFSLYPVLQLGRNRS